jgi:organic hydroperoxide reductase OsmC/OhrA
MECMSHHTATIKWKRNEAVFLDACYSRVHTWTFDGGAVLSASSSPHVVKIPYADPSCIDPEEAFVAALSSCHMLFFLSIAARAGLVVDEYVDAAEGQMVKVRGKTVIATVALRPAVSFSGRRAPRDEEVQRIHHEAHDSCFLANSVKCAIEIEGSWSHRVDAAAEPRGA